MPQRRAPRGHDVESNVGTSSAAFSPTPSNVSTYGTVRGVSVGADSGRATRSSKSKSATTLDPADSYMTVAGADGDCEFAGSYHHHSEAPRPDLKDQRFGAFDRELYDEELAKETSAQALGHSRDTCCGRTTATGTTDASKPVGKFRYVVASLIILGVTISTYASNTMYIAAIEMISSDVLQSGLTNLRAKHLSNDPLAVGKNAALPGTCPVEAVHHSQLAHQLVAALIEDKYQIKLPNASEISAREKLALQQDTNALYADVNQRLASGQLVDWSIQERGYVFTAHTLGTILMAVPISRLGLTYGSKVMTFICILMAALRMALLPTIAGHAPFWVTFTFELVIGGAGGNIIILGYPIAAAWLLPHEANFFVAINILSSLVGTAATNFVSTQLLASGLDWCWCYYIPGIMLFLLAVCWHVWGADRPETSRFISRAELGLLQSNTIAKRNESLLDASRNSASAGTSNPEAGRHDDGDETMPLTDKPGHHQKCLCPPEERAGCPASDLKRKPNWTVIFTCPTMWALILISFANHWTTKNATLWPTFFSNILHIDSSSIGIMLGIKGVWALIFGTLFAIATRKLVVNRPFDMSLTAYRRLNYAIATTIYAASVVLIVLMDCNIPANFVALLIQPVVSSFNSIGPDQMPLDMSAEDSGLLVSVIRLLAVGDIVALPVSSYILSYAQNAFAGDRLTWRVVWLVGLAIRILTALYFVLVAKSEPKSYSRLEPSGPCNRSKDKR